MANNFLTLMENVDIHSHRLSKNSWRIATTKIALLIGVSRFQTISLNRSKGFVFLHWREDMFTFSTLRMMAIIGFAITLFSFPEQSAFAQGRLRLSADIGGVKAKAKYEERSERRKFNFQLEQATPGQFGTVTATTKGRVDNLGSFTVNALRRGIIDIDTTEGDFVNDLDVGTIITLRIGGRSYSGVLR